MQGTLSEAGLTALMEEDLRTEDSDPKRPSTYVVGNRVFSQALTFNTAILNPSI